MLRLWNTLRARIWAAVAAGSIAALVVAPSALAHARLDSSTPSNDQVLRRAPQQVLLRFSEPVETAFGSVRVIDGAARRVDDARTTRPDPTAVAVGLPSDLSPGTYTVAWRVVPADSHPVSGAFVFHIGKPGAGAAGVVGQVARRARRVADRRARVLARPLPQLDAHSALRRRGDCARLRAGWGVRRGAQIAVDPPCIPRMRARLALAGGHCAPRRTGNADLESTRSCVDP